MGPGAVTGLYFALPGEPPLWPGSAAAVSGLGYLTQRQPALLMLTFGFGLIFSGFTAAQWRTFSVAAPEGHGHVTGKARSAWRL